MTKARVCLGAFAGAHGVRGEAKVRTFTENEDGIARYGAVESEDGARRFSLKFIRVLKPGLAVVSAPEIKSREDAAALAGVRLYVDRAALPAAGSDEYYVEDLIDLDAVDDAGRPLGRIVALHHFGAGDILEIGAKDGTTAMVPFTNAAVPSIDLVAGVVTIAASALAGDADDEAMIGEAMRQEDA
jgi:16S rRNA processing protein RimM